MYPEVAEIGIPVKEVNQDSLENFFGLVRSQAGGVVRPNAQQFSWSFKKLFNNFLPCDDKMIEKERSEKDISLCH